MSNTDITVDVGPTVNTAPATTTPPPTDVPVGNLALNSTNLATNPPFKITSPEPATGSSALAGTIESNVATTDEYLKGLETKAKDAATAKDDALSSYLKNVAGGQGESTLTAEAYANTGVDTAAADLKEINQQILAEQVSSRRAIEALKLNPQGLFGTGLADKITELNDKSTARQADLSVIQLARQGKYDSAKTIADRQVAASLERQKAQNEALRINYEDNKSLFTTAEQRQFEAQQKERDAKLASKAADAKSISDFSLEALKQGVPVSTALAIRGASSLAEAITISGLYGDTASLGATPEEAAYAQEYAATGKIPTGVSGAKFGRISALAKELPKPDGALVDRNTGIKPSTAAVGDTLQGGIISLYDLTKKLDEAEVLFNNLKARGETGAIGGTLGSVFQSNDRVAYDTLRGEIVDLLARARSGAALTASEEAIYKRKIPSEWNQAFFVGPGGSELIKGLKSSLAGKLDTTLNATGTAIYGYTKVTGGDGQQYTVGQTIRSADGSTGIVLPDGNISVQSSGTPSSTGGPVSITIPQGTLAFANNNPGNLRFAGQTGAAPGKGGFARFDSPQEGFNALKHQIALDVSRGHTLKSFINKYAPPSENDTGQYIQQVAQATGISPTAPLTSSDIEKLARAVAKKESSSSIA